MDFGNPMIKKIMLALWVSTLSTNALSTTFYLGHLSHPSTAKYAEFFTAVPKTSYIASILMTTTSLIPEKYPFDTRATGLKYS